MTKAIKKKNESFEKFKKYLELKKLTEENDELKNTIEKVKLDIEVKINLYGKFPLKRQYNKGIVGMLNQIKGKL